ncbi:hypothetical protein NDU88_004591 [Pleurodeles waltl]|uniref:Uncharacterized protein n=1 Tax=Pleurodeles waltl TaxID=8319 RepID=A0AAV7SJ85_PLEWA|nr:hypothetical protein NDU88_004591 [Pleurodeles waltl]
MLPALGVGRGLEGDVDDFAEAVFEGGFLCRYDEVIVIADGVLEGGMVVQSPFEEPLSLQFPTGLLRDLKVRGEPAGSLVGISVGRFDERGEGVGTVVDPVLEVAGCEVGIGGFCGCFSGEAGVQLDLADFAPVVAGDLLCAVVHGEFLEGEMDAAVVGPWEFGGVAEGDMGASREDRVQCVASRVCWGSDELSESEGHDPDGVLVDDGNSASDSVGAIVAGDLVAIRNGYGDVWGGGGFHPGLRQEGNVWGGGVEQVPEFDGVFASGVGVK